MYNLGIRSGKQYVEDKLNESIKSIDFENKDPVEQKGILKGIEFINKLSEESYEERYREKERNINNRIKGLNISKEDRKTIKKCYWIYKRTKKHRIKKKQFTRTKRIINSYDGIKVVDSYTFLLESNIKKKYKTVTVVYINGLLSEYDIETLKDLAFLYNVNFHSLKIDLEPEKPEDPEEFKGTVKEAMAKKAKGFEKVVNDETIRSLEYGFNNIGDKSIEKAILLDSLGYEIAIKYPIRQEDGREIAYMMIKDQMLLGYGFNEAEGIIREALEEDLSVEYINENKDNLKEILNKKKLINNLESTEEETNPLINIFNNLINKIVNLFKVK